ncbi:hypothetical protein EJ08DRAFT_694434 [Tothia fuscella]|uniref:RlpA-like protein double-psi beta-barrel domain-containing protein n=1 Tax=Tothia fuscella TaxID=1048955 RepID=A0A9P4NXN6_9PEZI|nr:hypothetical protein EJ08DRAFT_694434 [Tothia fuscella]
MSSVKRKPLASWSERSFLDLSDGNESKDLEKNAVLDIRDEKSPSREPNSDTLNEKNVEAANFPNSQSDSQRSNGYYRGATRPLSAEEERSDTSNGKKSVKFNRESRVGPPLSSWDSLKARFYPDRKILGLSRKWFFILVGVLFATVVGLIAGLSVGLGRRTKYQNIPLPQNTMPHTGDLTYYTPGTGACGVISFNTDHVVAISHLVFDAVQHGSNPNANPLCGKKIRASRYNERAKAQRSVDLLVVDRCTGCKPDDIDVTTSVFDQLAERDLGRTQVTWAWLDVDTDHL